MSAQEYAEREGLTLDTSLKLRDLGVSAFKGKNAREGALKEFMEAVEAGKVKAGSYLLIEDMDRLTRLPVMEGFAVFQRILAGGITIVTLKNGAKYSSESLAKDWTPIMQVFFDMSRGWGESDRKSYLLGKAWKKKQEDALKLKPMGDNAPRWLDYVEDKRTGEGRYEPIEERVDIVNRIFQWSIEGHGHSSITAMLNKQEVKPFRREGTDTKENKRSTWGTTSVARLLGNRAVLGEYQPWSVAGSLEKRTKVGDPVPGYFPQIVATDVFNRAQEAIESRRISRTKKQAKHFNVWQGIGLCAGCRAAMCLNKKGVSRLDPDTPLTYLVCANREKGVCEATGVRLDASEQVFRHVLALTGNLSLVESDVALQESQLQAARGRLIADQAKYDDLVQALDESPSSAGAILLTKQEQRLLDTKEEIARLEALLAANTVIDRESFFERIDLKSRPGRNQANALLKRLGIKVTIRKAGSRSKVAYYNVYQHEKLIVKLRDEAGTISESSYSAEVTMRLFKQGELEEHQLEANVAFRSEKYLKEPI